MSASGSTLSTSAKQRGVLLSAATLSQFGASVTQQGTVVLGVFFASTYHLSLSQMGAVIASMMFGLMLSGLFMGPLVDRWGPRRLLLAGTVALVVCALMASLSATLPLTMALLFVLGLLLGVVPLAGTKTVLVMWPRERRGLPMGIRQMGVPLGALAAALTLPTLASQVGLHPLYAAFAVILAICGLLFWAVLPPNVAAPAPRDVTARTRVITWRAAGPAAVGFLLAWSQYSLLTYTIPMLRERGVSLALAGALLAVSQIGGALGRMALGAISDRTGGRRERTLAAVTTLGIVLALVLANLPHGLPGWALVALWFVLGFAYVGWNALALTWVGEAVAEERAGAAIGVMTSAILAGATVSAPMFGLIVEQSGGYHSAWLTLALILAVASTLLWIYARRPEHLPSTQGSAPATSGAR